MSDDILKTNLFGQNKTKDTTAWLVVERIQECEYLQRKIHQLSQLVVNDEQAKNILYSNDIELKHLDKVYKALNAYQSILENKLKETNINI